MTVSGRIDIRGQKGVCESSGVTVDRSMPAILAGRMPYFSWTSFCDKLDEALLPVTNLKNANKYFVIIAISVFFVCVLFAFVYIEVAREDINKLGFMIPFIIAIVGIVGGWLGMLCFSARRKRLVNEAMEMVCDETSVLNPGITFQVKYEELAWGYGRDTKHTLNYIEVIVSGDAEHATTNDTPPTGQGYEAPTAPLASEESEETDIEEAREKQSSTERVDDASQMQGLLSEE